jgi:hypothetical protein
LKLSLQEHHLHNTGGYVMFLHMEPFVSVCSLVALAMWNLLERYHHDVNLKI